MFFKKPNPSSIAPTNDEDDVAVVASSAAPRSPQKSRNERLYLVISSNNSNLLFQSLPILRGLWSLHSLTQRFFFNLYQNTTSWGLALKLLRSNHLHGLTNLIPRLGWSVCMGWPRLARLRYFNSSTIVAIRRWVVASISSFGLPFLKTIRSKISKIPFPSLWV